MAEPTPKKTPAKPKEPPERPEITEFLRWKRNGIKIHWQLVDGSALIGTLNAFDNYWYQEAAEP